MMTPHTASQAAPLLSFEFFPPKNTAGSARLLETRQRLAALNPAYFSVTFGAGGSTRDRTLEIVTDIHQHDSVPVAPHISCISATQAELLDLLHTYHALGIRRIVALRGDLPSGTGTGFGDFRYAAELVAFVREHFGADFHIEVAAYPEVHPQAANAEKDLQHFQHKVAAGADAAITQYFYNADAYLSFVERVQAMGITIPIIPGIMPITNYTQLARFSETCGAEIPRYIRKRLEAYGDDTASIQAFGIDCVSRLCARLLADGAPGLHFYSMNQATASETICRNLGLAPAPDADSAAAA